MICTRTLCLHIAVSHDLGSRPLLANGVFAECTLICLIWNIMHSHKGGEGKCLLGVSTLLIFKFTFLLHGMINESLMRIIVHLQKQFFRTENFLFIFVICLNSHSFCKEWHLQNVFYLLYLTILFGFLFTSL